MKTEPVDGADQQVPDATSRNDASSSPPTAGKPEPIVKPYYERVFRAMRGFG